MAVLAAAANRQEAPTEGVEPSVRADSVAIYLALGHCRAETGLVGILPPPTTKRPHVPTVGRLGN